jgi:hypothetical protein
VNVLRLIALSAGAAALVSAAAYAGITVLQGESDIAKTGQVRAELKRASLGLVAQATAAADGTVLVPTTFTGNDPWGTPYRTCAVSGPGGQSLVIVSAGKDHQFAYAGCANYAPLASGGTTPVDPLTGATGVAMGDDQVEVSYAANISNGRTGSAYWSGVAPVGAGALPVGAFAFNNGKAFYVGTDKSLKPMGNQSSMQAPTSCSPGYVGIPQTQMPSGHLEPAFCVQQFLMGNGQTTNYPGASAGFDPSVYSGGLRSLAVTACAENGAQLISGPQYLAIAQRVAQNDVSWSGGKAGLGTLQRGFNTALFGTVANKRFTTSNPGPVSNQWDNVSAIGFQNPVYSRVFYPSGASSYLWDFGGVGTWTSESYPRANALALFNKYGMNPTSSVLLSGATWKIPPMISGSATTGVRDLGVVPLDWQPVNVGAAPFEQPVGGLYVFPSPGFGKSSPTYGVNQSPDYCEDNLMTGNPAASNTNLCQRQQFIPVARGEAASINSSLLYVTPGSSDANWSTTTGTSLTLSGYVAEGIYSVVAWELDTAKTVNSGYLTTAVRCVRPAP